MQEKYGARFYCPLLPSFTKKLFMPEEFVKNIGMDEKRKVASIVTFGKIWHVDFFKEIKGSYIGGKGWENFVKAHGLKDDEMLVFRYRGDRVFSLRVFDKITRCEKIYPNGSHMCVKATTVFSDHDDDEESNIVQKPTNSSCKKRKVQELNHTTNSAENMAGDSQDKVRAETEINCSRKLYFETTIKAYNLSGKRLFMDIPSEFIESAGLEPGELMLCDPQGQIWHVGLYKCKLSGAIYISKGWLEFARGNMLKEGDRCIFELASSQRKKRVMNLKILSHTPTRQTDQTKKIPKSSSKVGTISPGLQHSESPENHNTSNTMTRGAHFEVTMMAHQLAHYCMIKQRKEVSMTSLDSCCSSGRSRGPRPSLRLRTGSLIVQEMEEKYHKRFFCPLLPGFTKKMLVPQELVKNIYVEENRKVASIVTSGKIWHVEFYKEMQDFYIGGKGWKNFVEAHGLKDYDMLVFSYRGNMVFTLRVFDEINFCEKIYHYGSHRCVKDPMIFSDHGSSQDQVPAEMERNCSKKLSFEKIIKHYFLIRSMAIPSEFTRSNGLKHLDELMLSDPKGRTWLVGLSKCRQSQSVYVSKGWRKFARANHLKEGDRCIFELLASPQGKKRLMNVKILDRTPAPARQIDRTGEMPKCSSKGPTKTPDLQHYESPEDHNTLKTTTTGAYFEVTISAHQLTLSHVYVPKRFREATGLEKLSEVIVIDPKDQRWTVSLYHFRRRSSRRETYLRRFWRQFATSNRLQEGDKCIFELLPEKDSSNVIRVQILNRS